MPRCPKCNHSWRTDAQREYDNKREKTRPKRDRAAYMRERRKTKKRDGE
jgi:hypothetical protein